MGSGIEGKTVASPERARPGAVVAMPAQKVATISIAALLVFVILAIVFGRAVWRSGEAADRERSSAEAGLRNAIDDLTPSVKIPLEEVAIKFRCSREDAAKAAYAQSARLGNAVTAWHLIDLLNYSVDDGCAIRMLGNGDPCIDIDDAMKMLDRPRMDAGEVDYIRRVLMSKSERL